MQTSYFTPSSLPSEILFLILTNLADSSHKQQYLRRVALSGSILRTKAERLMYKSIRLTNGGQVDALFDALTSAIRGRARVGYVKTLKIVDKSPDNSIEFEVSVLRTLLAMLPNLLELQVRALRPGSMKTLTNGVVCHAKLQRLVMRSIPHNIVGYFAGQRSIKRLTLTHSISLFPVPEGLRDILPNLEDVTGPALLLAELIPGRPVSRVTTWTLFRPSANSHARALGVAMAQSAAPITFFSCKWMYSLDAETFRAMGHGLSHVESMEVKYRHYGPPNQYSWLDGLDGYNNLHKIYYTHRDRDLVQHTALLNALRSLSSICPTLQYFQVGRPNITLDLEYAFDAQVRAWSLVAGELGSDGIAALQ
ncbi:hypothetical protein FRB95_004587 [Tulasnella sp. JGI-2019a]|nr:hypothetical protein FRB95_004587 [Tulasnella sp. JGI-2019a]